MWHLLMEQTLEQGGEHLGKAWAPAVPPYIRAKGQELTQIPPSWALTITRPLHIEQVHGFPWP